MWHSFPAVLRFRFLPGFFPGLFTKSESLTESSLTFSSEAGFGFLPFFLGVLLFTLLRFLLFSSASLYKSISILGVRTLVEALLGVTVLSELALSSLLSSGLSAVLITVWERDKVPLMTSLWPFAVRGEFLLWSAFLGLPLFFFVTTFACSGFTSLSFLFDPLVAEISLTSAQEFPAVICLVFWFVEFWEDR